MRTVRPPFIRSLRRALLPVGAAGALLTTTLVGGPVAAEPAATDAAGGALGGPSRLVEVEPCRLLDTRRDTAVSAESTIEVQVAGRCSTPGDAVAAAVTLTATGPEQPGFLTAWGEGDRPATSNVNYEAGQAIANFAIVPLGSDGELRMHTSATSHLLVDVSAVFVTTESATAGRYVPTEPERVHDSRDGDPLGSGDTVTVTVPDSIGTDVSAIAATVTVIDAGRDGFVTAHGPDTDPPDASVLNVTAGETRAASTIVPVSDGRAAFTVDAGGHLAVDVTGVFTGDDAASSSDGLFVPAAPIRLHDSRSERWALGAGATREVPVPGDVAAWAVNVTATGVRADGYVTALPARTERPDTSVLNPTAGTTTANSAIVPTTEHGLAAFASAPLDVIVDGFGWFTGDPVPATTGPAPDDPAPRRVLVIGDSAAAGMRWNGTLDALRGAEYTTDLQSCRRLVTTSCNGREGFVPANALTALERQPYGSHDTLVMATGYNDPGSGFENAFETINAAARANGVRDIVWVTLREDVGYQIPNGFSRSYASMNDIMVAGAASQPDVHVMDWWTYTEDAPGWLGGDGVHLTRVGSYGFADMISRTVASLDQQPCPDPWEPDGAVDDPCPDPASLPSERGGVPDVVAIHDD